VRATADTGASRRGRSGAAIGALKAASKTVPIVMSMSDYDPVTAGFAESFARPGGNITGIAMFATVLDAPQLLDCLRKL